MAYIDFAELKANFSIQNCFDQLGLSMKQTGDAFRGPCPACQSGGDRALVVTPSKHSFYCFGAKTGGDVIALVAHIRNSDMKSAAAFLEEKGNGETTQKTSSDTSTVPKERAKETARSFQPLSYLEPEHHLVQKLGVSVETCIEFGAGFASKGIMRGRLAIPIHDENGTLVAYCGRTLKGEHPKLIFPKGFAPDEFLFTAHQAVSKFASLVWDPLDVLIASQSGVLNVISVLTETINTDQLRLLADYLDRHGIDAIELH